MKIFTFLRNFIFEIFHVVLAAVFLIPFVATLSVDNSSDWEIYVDENNTNPYITEYGQVDIAAHRGGGGNAPQNTMMAMEMLVADRENTGADIAEFDVQLTKDGKLVLILSVLGAVFGVWMIFWHSAILMILLGIYYVIVIVCYLVFEMIPINYRPILINGFMEASYPSSTTLLVLSVMPTLVFQVERRAGNNIVRKLVFVLTAVFSAFMVIGRLLSGVHWITDIIGGILISTGLVSLYRFAVGLGIKN